MATTNELYEWVNRDFCRAGGPDKVVLFDEPNDHFGLRFKIFTDTNQYSIVARDTDDSRNGDGGYLGCVSSSRKPRAGEDWTRGNDLADGPLSEETWRCILADIIGYELVRIHRPKDEIVGAGIPESAPAAPAA